MDHKTEYQLFLTQINTLAERRQSVTSTYLSVNAALTGAIAFLFKDGQLTTVAQQVSVLILLFSGIISCGLWRKLIEQHSALLDWWYEQLRLLEDKIPQSSKLITKEYEELYRGKRRKPTIGLTRYESRLTWLFSSIYVVFSLAILITLISILG